MYEYNSQFVLGHRGAKVLKKLNHCEGTVDIVPVPVYYFR